MRRTECGPRAACISTHVKRFPALKSWTFFSFSPLPLRSLMTLRRTDVRCILTVSVVEATVVNSLSKRRLSIMGTINVLRSCPAQGFMMQIMNAIQLKSIGTIDNDDFSPLKRISIIVGAMQWSHPEQKRMLSTIKSLVRHD